MPAWPSPSRADGQGGSYLAYGPANAGDDVITGGNGSDVLDDGTGNDTVDFRFAA